MAKGLPSFARHPRRGSAPIVSSCVFGWEVHFGIDLPRRLRLEAYYGETDYALNSATGFESDQWGILVRYRF